MTISFSFLQNKYSTWYFNIIKNAQLRTIVEGYYEKHHIIPKCLGGTNLPENIVKLTGREHFICHWLLTKMLVNKKQKYQMWNAFSSMLYRENPNQERYKVTSKIFENIKKEGAKIKSWKMTGEKHPMYGRRGADCPVFGKTWTDEHRKNASISHTGQTRSLEARQKQSEKTKGRKQSAEHIKNRSGQFIISSVVIVSKNIVG